MESGGSPLGCSAVLGVVAGGGSSLLSGCTGSLSSGGSSLSGGPSCDPASSSDCASSPSVGSSPAPPLELLRIDDPKTYAALYRERVLDRLDPQKVYADLEDTAVLLCYEKWANVRQGKSFCHRRLAAQWLEENMAGLVVDEIEV